MIPLPPVQCRIPSQCEIDIWQQAFKKIKEQQSLRKELAMNTLSWMTHSKMPMALHALVVALSIDVKSSFRYSFLIGGADVRVVEKAAKKDTSDREVTALGDDPPSPQGWEADDKAWDDAPSLFDICEGLLGSSTLPNAVLGNQVFMHLKAWPSHTTGLKTLFPDADSRMAATCLHYLSRNEVLEANQLARVDAQSAAAMSSWLPFKSYAETCWTLHYVAADDPGLDHLVIEYFRKIYMYPATWIDERKPLWRDKYYVEVTDDETPLIKAARLCLLRVLERLLLSDEYDIDAESWNRESAISVAVSAGATSIVQLLNRFGASLHYRNNFGVSLLHMATKKDDEVMVALLINLGLNPDTQSAGNRRETALQCAADNNSVQSARVLLGHKADISSQRSRLMMAAASKGYEDFVKLLVEYGFDLAAPSVGGEPPLCAAAGSGSLSLVQYMVENGAKVNDLSYAESSAIHRAAAKGHLSMVKWLLEHGADPFRVSTHRKGVNKDFDRTAMEEAIWAKHRDVADLLFPLLDKGVSTDLILKMVTTAIKAKAVDIAKLLFFKIHGILADCEKGRWDSLLRAAIETKDDVMLEFLIDRGISITAPEDNKYTLLHAASTMKIADLLLKRGTDPNTRDAFGATPTHVAARSGKNEVLDTLLNWGVDLTIRDEDEGATALVAAGCGDFGGHPEAVRLLLRHGANPNDFNDDGETILHYAILDNDSSLVEEILSHMTDTSLLSVLSRRGGSALHLAAYKGFADIVKMLLARGADVELGHEFCDGSDKRSQGDESNDESAFGSDYDSKRRRRRGGRTAAVQDSGALFKSNGQHCTARRVVGIDLLSSC
jgi:ankyrin repeat protein